MLIRKSISTRLGMVCFSILLILSAAMCNYRPVRNDSPAQNTAAPAEQTTVPTGPATKTPASSLTVCMGQEPASLFLYGDGSQAARSIRQAIYDGPVDIVDYEPRPVILEAIPSLGAGGVVFEPVIVSPGESLVDSSGIIASLGEGVSLLPSGCSDPACAIGYSGSEPIQIDQQVVRFKLKTGLTWADGSPLTADDSQYSFEVAKSLYPRARANQIARTRSYRALDETTVEWRSIPGYRTSGYLNSFFSPLPRRAWSAFNAEELLTADDSSRKPLGWGAYKIDEWISGDRIALSRNTGYFRKSEGMPAFQTLIFRFIPSPEQAVSELLSGACDILDETIDFEAQHDALQEAQNANQLVFTRQAGTAWEHLDFAIASRDPAALPVFQAKEMRQAAALCLDRQKIIAELHPGLSLGIDSYIPSDHPLFNPDQRHYPFDPDAANALLESIGWRDDDTNPMTARRASGAAGIEDGTPLEFTLLTTDETTQQRLAEMVRDSLAQCGMAVTVSGYPKEQLFSTGAQAPLFGRNFTLSQFSWMGAWQPPCFLYTSQEIPGPYPEFPQGWGGANLSGYSSLDFDRACLRALATMPEQPEYKAAHYLAQSVFAEELPALPLFLHVREAVACHGLCGLDLNPSADSDLWNIEGFSEAESCNP